MQFNIMGKVSTLSLLSEGECIDYLAREVSKGADLLPLFKVLSTSKLRNNVLAVSFNPPYLTALVHTHNEHEYMADDDSGFRPLTANTIAIGGYSEELAAHEIDLPGLVQFCLMTGMTEELGITEPEDPEKASLLKQVESLEIELESAQEINSLLIDLVQGLAQEKGEQLQEQITDAVSSRMLHNSAASQLVASTGDDLSDLFSSPLGGILQNDIRNEIRSQISKLHIIDRLALCLTESDEVLKDWVDNQFCAFPTPTSCTEIDLDCEDLVGRIAREVESRIHLESDE